jgi:ribosomal protein S27AE
MVVCMKALIIVYLLATVALIAVVPYKLLTSVQSKCPGCGESVFYAKRKKKFDCPHCGAAVVLNGCPVRTRP